MVAIVTDETKPLWAREMTIRREPSHDADGSSNALIKDDIESAPLQKPERMFRIICRSSRVWGRQVRASWITPFHTVDSWSHSAAFVSDDDVPMVTWIAVLQTPREKRGRPSLQPSM
jgi:hypothetical protein